jgi:pimeloyl-ACP methyl ester carboxylesterase
MILPYHFNRKSKESLFGGEFFFSADLYRTRNAFKQAVMDIETAMQLIGLHNSLPASVSGFSMGGCVVFQYYLLKKGKVKAFLINPVTEYRRLAWDNTLLLTVGKDLEKSSLRKEEITRIFDELDPVENIGTDFSSDNLAMAYSAYDQIVGKRKYGSFIEKIEIKNVVEYSAGHLNVLRVPRLADDINDFLSNNLSSRSVAANAPAVVSGG